MLGLFIIYFIGREFYNLAHDFDKSRWGFAILGIASYYFGTFVAGIILGVIVAFSNSNFLETTPKILINLMSLPVGLLFCWGFYKILEKQWSKKSRAIESNVLDGSIIDNN
jgi:hypothetical protein